MCVGVTLWYGWGGVVSVCRLKPAYGYHTNASDIKLVSLYSAVINIPYRICISLCRYYLAHLISLPF